MAFPRAFPRQPLSVDIDMMPPASILAHDFHSIGLQIRSFREPLRRSAQQVMGPSFQQNFDVGGRPPWAPLSEETLASYAKQSSRYPTQILMRTGMLRRTVGFLSIWTLTRESASIEDLPGYAFYGVFHQEGVSNDHFPERPFLLIQDQDADRIEEVFWEWIRERLDRNGFRAHHLEFGGIEA